MERLHYNNVCLLLQYLRSVVNTPKGDTYNHGSYGTCTFGFAAQSGLFPELGWNIDVNGYLRRVNLTSRNNSEEGYTESSYETFGADYTNTIVCVNNYISRNNEGKDQLRAAIGQIEKFLRSMGEEVPAIAPPKQAKVKTVKTAKTPNPDTAGKRILARIARIEKVKADIEKLGDDAKHFTVNIASMDAQIAALRDALAS